MTIAGTPGIITATESNLSRMVKWGWGTVLVALSIVAIAKCLGANAFEGILFSMLSLGGLSFYLYEIADDQTAGGSVGAVLFSSFFVWFLSMVWIATSDPGVKMELLLGGLILLMVIGVASMVAGNLGRELNIRKRAIFLRLLPIVLALYTGLMILG